MDLGLGTVQFGVPYGVSGRGEPVPEREVRAILEQASLSGIRMLDTAGNYGDIEARLPRLCAGLSFSVVSKIPAVESRPAATTARQFAVEAICRSQDRLGDMLEVMLFHRGDDILAADGEEVWETACSHASRAGLRLGVSCYAPDEVRAIRERVAVAVAQVPVNAFDQRIRSPGLLSKLGRVELHMRSIFLQGLLLMPYEEAVRRIPAAARPMAAWRAWCKSRELSPLVGALAIAKGMTGVKCAVVGVDSVSQLKEIVSAWRSAPVLEDTTVACADEKLIDPRQWRMA